MRALGAPFIHSMAPPLISAVKPYWIADVRLGKYVLTATIHAHQLRVFSFALCIHFNHGVAL